jgi:hypothetical protein
MIENIKPVESLTVADFRAHPVWEYLNDDEIGETFVGPVKECIRRRRRQHCRPIQNC